MASRSSGSNEAIRFGIEVEQPQASALVAGDLEVLHLFRPPDPELLGQCFAVYAGPVNSADLWLLPQVGVQLPKLGKSGQYARGLCGSVRLLGYLETRGGVLLRQHRVGAQQKPFRRLKGGLAGPFCWVFREGSVAKRPANGEAIRIVRAGYWDLPEVQQRLLCYAEKHGESGLDAESLKQLQRLRKGKESGRKQDPAGAAG